MNYSQSFDDDNFDIPAYIIDGDDDARDDDFDDDYDFYDGNFRDWRDYIDEY